MVLRRFNSYRMVKQLLVSVTKKVGRLELMRAN